ncbi:hypothetical protein BK658_27520 [Pseudomonas brassicacearum]|uniref:Uncharacterized protein n=1 Tax=Pseudomonas brassicacearum TaxID=930166 RepID=A0A423GIW4_9PSED|nr:hypothetical protein BK658_27520 [Pseudomonas brassicacearum]
MIPVSQVNPRFETAKIECGSELARDDGFTFDINVYCYTAIASKLAPTLDLLRFIECISLTDWWYAKPATYLFPFASTGFS